MLFDRMVLSFWGCSAGYQSHVPHYPMANPNPFRGIYQAFTIGRVRFILTDLRSNADLETPIVSTCPPRASYCF